MTNGAAKKISFLAVFRIFFTLPLLLLLAFLYLKHLKTENPPLPVYSIAPSFKLTERSGHVMTNADLEGKVWIADFIFTRCAGQCPMMSTQMKKLTGLLKKVAFVSFSTDPDYDTPEILSAYANGYEADPNQWFFLTGSKDILNVVSIGFKMSRIDDPMMHSTRFVLVDKKGQVRGIYDTTDPAAEKKLIVDARRLL